MRDKASLAVLSDRKFLNAIKNKTLLYTTDYGCTQKPREWNDYPTGNPLFHSMLSAGDDGYAKTINSFSRFSKELKTIGMNPPENDYDPYWSNEWFPMGDGIALYCLLALNKPKLYIEIGSGNSTKFAKKAISDHSLETQIISIDPSPRKEIDSLCDEVVRSGLENVDMDLFRRLEAGDILFIDCSHRSCQNSDVTVFFTEAMPSLASGVIWGMHDIFIPFDYPNEWLNKHDRYYNEQYLLMSYLLGSGGDEIYFPVNYLETCKPEFYSSFMESFGTNFPWGEGIPRGGSFWMKKR